MTSKYPPSNHSHHYKRKTMVCAWNFFKNLYNGITRIAEISLAGENLGEYFDL